ncbi:CPBP family intramembrane metalloprotease [Nocardiopsis coralliicola]
MPKRTAWSAVPWGEIALFTFLAYAVAWLIHLPLLLSGGGPDDPGYNTAARIYAHTPALVVLLMFAVRAWRPQEGFLRATGMVPLRPAGRLAGALLFAFALFIVLGLVATLTAAALGVVGLDLENFSGLRKTLGEQFPDLLAGAPAEGFPAGAYLAALGLMMVAVFPFSLITFAGEELAWRGYLFPRLLPAGLRAALLISGLIHAFWHSPQIFIQLDAGAFTPAEALLFVAFVVAIGVVLSGLRLVTGSVWPAVVGHAANNTFNVLAFLTLTDTEGSSAPLIYPTGLGGVVGLVLVGAAGAAIMAVAVRKRRRGSPALR